ncbi:hypothetical protein GCM10012275_16590 [Longimycelium tulufanense]|uniref:Uncharacterized protein n=1 Tax=Longimycelium tulufanense TaxID=907463 RepID=A0A8J3CDY3_9PSEU|nr:hypothetical protein [Longimycelium tulufanense]GGM46253.1 hypothetical protein GCM10012275_16590 [Longimycelium tulufanense]
MRLAAFPALPALALFLVACGNDSSPGNRTVPATATDAATVIASGDSPWGPGGSASKPDRRDAMSRSMSPAGPSALWADSPGPADHAGQDAPGSRSNRPRPTGAAAPPLLSRPWASGSVDPAHPVPSVRPTPARLTGSAPSVTSNPKPTTQPRPPAKPTPTGTLAQNVHTRVHKQVSSIPLVSQAQAVCQQRPECVRKNTKSRSAQPQPAPAGAVRPAPQANGYPAAGRGR